MGMKVKFCSCRSCRIGRHRGSRNKAAIRRVMNGARRHWNLLAAQERDEEITAVSIPYTD